MSDDATPTGASVKDTNPEGMKPKHAGTPPWAWGVIGLLAAAVLLGAAWMVYQTGRSAGIRSAALGGSAETTVTETTEVVTQTADAGTVAPGSGGIVPAEEPEPPQSDPPGGSSGGSSSGGGSSAGGSSGTSKYDLSLVKPLGLQPVAPKVPTTWKVILKHSNTGPWEMPNPPGAPLNAGYLRMTVLVTDNASESGYVQLRRVDGGAQLPDNGILYYWPAGGGSVIYKVTEPVLIEAGTYQLRASIHGPWTIMLEK